MSLLFNMLSSFVITFLPRRKHLLISWLQYYLQWFWSLKNKICHYSLPIYLPWSDGTRCHNFSFLNVELLLLLLLLLLLFSTLLFYLQQELFSSSSFSAIREVSSLYLRLLIFLWAILILASDSSSPAFHMMLLLLLLLFSHSVMSNYLRPHGLQHARLPFSLLSPRVCSNTCPLSQWCHPTISSFVSWCTLNIS